MPNDDVDVGEQERGFRERIGEWARTYGLGARAGAASSTRDGDAARADLLRWSADLFCRLSPSRTGVVTTGSVAAPAVPQAPILQFQVIRGPDEMVGSRNQGGARLLFFALDASGRLWQAVEEQGAPLAWTHIAGPLDPGTSSSRE